MTKKKILIDLERTKYPNTGLFTFCSQLYNSLKKYSQKYDYYCLGAFGQKNTLKVKSWHKLFGVPSPKFDVWHVTYQNSSYKPLRANIPVVLTVHDLNFLYTKISDKKKTKLLKEVQTLINRAAYVVVISEFVLKDVIKNCIVNKPIKVIHNGVDVKRFDTHVPTNIPTEKFLFTLGTVLPKKNFHVLVPLLKDTNYKLLIAGILPDQEYHHKIIAIAEEHGVTEQLVMLGAISEEDKYWYLKNCEAFFFPSLMEGFGLPVIEAMQLGKPVFISKKTCLPEIGGPNAYYFDNFKADHMSKVLELGLKDYRENKREESIKQWANQFSWEKSVAAYEQVYEDVIALKKKSNRS